MIVRWTKPAADDLAQICDYTDSHFGLSQGRRAALAIFEAAEHQTTFQAVAGWVASLVRVKSPSRVFHS